MQNKKRAFALFLMLDKIEGVWYSRLVYKHKRGKEMEDKEIKKSLGKIIEEMGENDYIQSEDDMDATEVSLPSATTITNLETDFEKAYEDAISEEDTEPEEEVEETEIREIKFTAPEEVDKDIEGWEFELEDDGIFDDSNEFVDQDAKDEIVVDLSPEERKELTREYVETLRDCIFEGNHKFTQQNCMELNRYIDEFGADYYVKDIVDGVLCSEDAEQIYNLADMHGVDMKAISGAIANTRDVDWIFKIAKDKVGVDLCVLSDAIAATSGDATIYKFAYESLETLIGAIEKGEHILTFSDCLFVNKYIDNYGRDEYVDELIDLVLDIHNPAQIYNLADLDDADMEAISEALADTGDVDWMIKLATDKVGADIGILSEAVVETQNPEAMFRFASEVKKSADKHPQDVDMEAIEDMIGVLSVEIAETGNPEWIYKFATTFKDANIATLCDAMAETFDAEYIYKFACDVEDLDKESIKGLSKAIAKTGDTEYMYRFGISVRSADQKLLSQKIAAGGEARLIIAALINFPKADVKALAKGAAAQKSAEISLRFLRLSPVGNIELLSKSAARSAKLAAGDENEFKAACELLTAFAPSNVDEYREVITKLDNKDFIARFHKVEAELDKNRSLGRGMVDRAA